MITAPAKPLSPLVLFVQWILFSSFGWFAGLGLGVFLTTKLTGQPGFNEDRALAYVTLLVLGVSLGVTQSLVLRSVLPEAGHWVKSTLAGFGLAMLVFIFASLVRLPAEGLLENALLLALMGAVVALPQWRLLRHQFDQAWVWLLASAFGWLSFLWLVAAPASEQYEFIVRGFFYGTLSVLPTGLVLLWLNHARQIISPAPVKSKRN